MTLDRSLDAWRQRYDSAEHGFNTSFDDIDCALATDQAIGDLMDTMLKAGFPLPGDDRIENVVTQVFKLACEYKEERNDAN